MGEKKQKMGGREGERLRKSSWRERENEGEGGRGRLERGIVGQDGRWKRRRD
jgi:hypothetical protein